MRSWIFQLCSYFAYGENTAERQRGRETVTMLGEVRIKRRKWSIRERNTVRFLIEERHHNIRMVSQEVTDEGCMEETKRKTEDEDSGWDSEEK